MSFYYPQAGRGDPHERQVPVNWVAGTINRAGHPTEESSESAVPLSDPGGAAVGVFQVSPGPCPGTRSNPSRPLALIPGRAAEPVPEMMRVVALTVPYYTMLLARCRAAESTVCLTMQGATPGVRWLARASIQRVRLVDLRVTGQGHGVGWRSGR